MKNKVMILSPVGGNGNYIALVLLNLLGKDEFCYHMQGTHGQYSNKIKHFHIWSQDAEHYLHNSEYITLQNVFDENFWFVIINCWEKCFTNRNTADRHLKDHGETWIKSQEKIWSGYRHPIVRAILHWFYAYLNREHPECKRIDTIQSTFRFDAFYKDHSALATEFKKFGIDYSNEAYDKWKTSQSAVFESYDKIVHAEFNDLEFDYQKGIKMGLRGMQENLDQQSCWEKYKKYID
jgi:hypothetical protein